MHALDGTRRLDGGVVMLNFLLGYLVGSAVSELVKASPPMSPEEALLWTVLVAVAALLAFVALLRFVKRSV